MNVNKKLSNIIFMAAFALFTWMWSDKYCPETDELFDVSDRSQLPAFNLSCVNCNLSHAILCGTYLII